MNKQQLAAELRPSIHEVDVSEAKKLIDNGSVILIDVREDYEYKAGHLADSINYPLSIIKPDQDSDLEIDFNQPILTYCAAGVRSIIASHYLKKQGFTNVMSMAGGIAMWQMHQHKIVI